MVIQGQWFTSHVVRVISHFNGKLQNLTTRISQTPSFFHTKICTDDYVQHISWCAKFGENPFTGGFPTNRWNITLAWLFVPFLSFPSLPFPFFLAVLYRKNDWTDFNARWLIWRGFAQGRVFWGLQNLNSTFSRIFFTKIWEITMALMGKIRQCFKLS